VIGPAFRVIVGVEHLQGGVAGERRPQRAGFAVEIAGTFGPVGHLVALSAHHGTRIDAIGFAVGAVGGHDAVFGIDHHRRLLPGVDDRFQFDRMSLHG